MTEIYLPFGVTLLIDLVGCERLKFGRSDLEKIAKKAKMTPLKYSQYSFSGGGKTGVLIIAESHIAVHTYPEYKFVTIDLYACGKRAKIYNTIEGFEKLFLPKYLMLSKNPRGINN